MAEYIEREILLNTLDEVCRVACPYSERRDIAQYVKCGACPLWSAFDFIDDIPSADVQSVERRKDCHNLIDYKSLFEYSNCGWTSSDTYVCDPMKYCPGCGARIVKQEVRDD